MSPPRHLTLKRARLEAADCPSYWTGDPDDPSVTVWQLRDEGYVEVARVVGDEQADLQAPYPVALVPAKLVS